jgi:putative resolvase
LGVVAHQRGDLDRQVARLTTVATERGLAPNRFVAEVGSGLNCHRAQLLSLLGDPGVGIIVVEHRDRQSRFGVEYSEAALGVQGRRVVVVEQTEVTDDVVGDMVEVVTRFCAGLHGLRSARRRAQAALVATQSEAAA